MKTIFTVLGIVTAVGVASLLHPVMQCQAAPVVTEVPIACSVEVEETTPAEQIQVESNEEQPESPACEVDHVESPAPTEAAVAADAPSCSQ